MRLKLFLFLLGVCLGIIGYNKVIPSEVEPITISDTVYRIDTLFYEPNPKIVYKKVYVKEKCLDENPEYERLESRW